MRWQLHQGTLAELQSQRNFLLGLCVVLTITGLLQISLLCIKQQKIIINPPEVKQSYWVKGNQVSNSYQEEMALFFTHLLLDVTAPSLLAQGEVLLRHVSPGSYGAFQQKLLADHKRLKAQQLSLQFWPQAVTVVQPLTVEVTGLLASYVAAQQVGQVKESYRLKFTQKYGQLWLDSFQLITTERKDVAENS